MVALLSSDSTKADSFCVDYAGLTKLIGVRIHNSTLLAWESAGRFPRRFRLPSSPRALWRTDEIRSYLQGAAAARGLIPAPDTSAATRALARKRARSSAWRAARSS